MKKTVLGLSLALLGAHALAADTTWYVGGDLSSTKFKVEGESERKTGLGLFAGYALNPNVAFEAQIRRFGSWDVEGIDVSANSLSVSMIGKAPMSDAFALFARVGMARNSIDVTEGGFSASAHENKALIGVGGEYALSKNSALRVEFVNYGNNKIGSGADQIAIKIQQYNVAFRYAF